MVCRKCGYSYSLPGARWKCDCGGILDIRFIARIDPEKLVGRKLNIWRYREALPVSRDEFIVSFDEGMTPLLEMTFSGRKALVKMEQLFHTGSYKDRGASVLISKALELGVNRVVEDSSGNAGCSIAAYCASAGIECHIYVPESTSPAKTAQIEIYGARLHRVPGSREDTAQAALKAAEESYYASHSWNPFFFQGTKTYAFEIWEQLGFNAPDALLIPTGNGTLLIGAYLGFKDLLNLKLIETLPKIVAVQAENCAPLYRMFKEKTKKIPRLESRETVAEGIRIADPVRGTQIVEIVERTGGEIIAVSEIEIEEALLEMGRRGLFIEPTSATTVAGLRKGSFSPDEIVVLPLTGHGLKSAGEIMKIYERRRS